MSISLSLFLFLWSAAPISPEIAAKDKYLLARRAFLNQNWKEAKQLFQETLELLSQVKGQTERQRHLFIIGRSDVRFHLAQIADQQKEIFPACRLYKKIRDRVDQLPTGWESWPINTKLPERFAVSKRRLDECNLVPSVVSWTLTPPDASVEMLAPVPAPTPSTTTPPTPTNPTTAAPPPSTTTPPSPAKTTTAAPSWMPVQSPIQRLPGLLRLRIRAAGFLPQEKDIQVLAWEEMRLVFSLKPQPRKRDVAVVVRRPIQPVAPPTTPTWVWITVAAGVVVVGGAVAIGVYAATRPLEKVTVSFR